MSVTRKGMHIQRCSDWADPATVPPYIHLLAISKPIWKIAYNIGARSMNSLVVIEYKPTFKIHAKVVILLGGHVTNRLDLIVPP